MQKTKRRGSGLGVVHHLVHHDDRFDLEHHLYCRQIETIAVIKAAVAIAVVMM